MNLNLYRFSLLTKKLNNGFKAVKKTLLVLSAIIYSAPAFAQAPAPPTAVTASPAVICKGNAATIKATSVGNTIRWYTVANGGVSVATSASGAGVSVFPTGSVTYYAESVSPLDSVSHSRGAVTLTVNTAPVLTFIPPDINSSNTTGQCGTVVVYPQALATGSPTPTILYSNPSGQNFSVGTTTVLTTAVNTCGSSSLSFDVTVNDNEPPVVITPMDTNIVLAPGVYTLSSSSLVAPGATDNCGIITITNDAPSVLGPGTTTITWTATDDIGLTAQTVQHVTIAAQGPSAPPVIDTITSNADNNAIPQNSSATLNINWEAQANGGPYNVDIDWRDSSAHTVISSTTNSASVNHLYKKAGVFAPVVIVTNSGNFSTTYIYKFVVVYVVGNYSTTSNGHFTAPQGALVSMPNLSTCSRNVEFGVQCKPKSCRPGVFDGDLDLEMNGAHFDFETEDVDWDYLAVSACYLAQFEGSGYMYPNGHKKGCHGCCHGSCNPTGYHFGILVVQSDKKRNSSNANKIRVKIWNKDNGSLIFDTQPGDPDNALPTTPFSGTIQVCVPANCVARMEMPDGSPIPTGMFQATVSPNPFNSVFNVNVITSSTENITVNVYDVMGKMVKQITDVLPNQPIGIEGNFDCGMYFIHVKQGNRTQVVRMIKNVN